MTLIFRGTHTDSRFNPCVCHSWPQRGLNWKSVVVWRNHLYCPGTPAPKLGPVGPRGQEGGACPRGLTGPSLGQEGPPLPALGVQPGQVSVWGSQLGPRIRYSNFRAVGPSYLKNCFSLTFWTRSSFAEENADESMIEKVKYNVKYVLCIINWLKNVFA